MPDSSAPAPQFEIPGFRGELVRPDHGEYDSAREVFNGMIDRRPALKDEWDPSNLFRHNQNIPPSAG